MLRVTSQWMLFTTRHYSLKRGAHPNFDQDD